MSCFDFGSISYDADYIERYTKEKTTRLLIHVLEVHIKDLLSEVRGAYVSSAHAEKTLLSQVVVAIIGAMEKLSFSEVASMWNSEWDSTKSDFAKYLHAQTFSTIKSGFQSFLMYIIQETDGIEKLKRSVRKMEMLTEALEKSDDREFVDRIALEFTTKLFEGAFLPSSIKGSSVRHDRGPAGGIES